MREMDDCSIDFIVTDPPYFLTNNSGFGFMGKSWDSIHGLSKYLWESNTFVNSAIYLMNSLLLEKNILEESFVVENAVMPIQEVKNQKENAQFVNKNLLSVNLLKKDSADLLVLTKQEVWGLLKELSPNHMQTVDKFLNGVSENVVFVVPITLLVKELNNIALKNVLQKPKVKDLEVRGILLSLMDQAVLKNAIEGMIGTRLESLSTNEINGHVNTALSIAKEKKFSVITLSHIERADLITWITSLLCVINAIRSLNTIPNYLIQNFYKQIFVEALRICKPGSMIAVFGGARTFHRLTSAIEDSGFIIKDVCMFLHGQGFPKAMNFGKKLNGQWEGYSSCGLKPAYEPIIIAEKRIEKNYTYNAEKWGVAGINIESCRIPTNETIITHEIPKQSFQGQNYRPWHDNPKEAIPNPRNSRWPANIILDESAAEQLGNNSRVFYCAKASQSERSKGLEGMPLKRNGTERMNNSNGRKKELGELERLTLTKNSHPCIKPISLMKYIIKLLAPPGDPICLDPFAGSGTTILACQQLGIRAIGIEKEKEYCDIAEARLKHALQDL